MTKSFYQKFITSRFRKPVGVILIILGFLALVTPLTPGSWLAFIGLELLGLRFAFNRFFSKLFGRDTPSEADKQKALGKGNKAPEDS